MSAFTDGRLSGFRIQMVAFILVTLLVTAVVLSFFNQRLERRTAAVVEDYVRDITLATDIVYRSFSSGEYLYDMVNRAAPDSLTIDEESVIQHILVVDADGLVFDSSSAEDLRRPYQSVLDRTAAAPAGAPGLTEFLGWQNGQGSDGLPRSLSFTIETERGVRRIFIIISMNRLTRVRESQDRVRLIALTLFGLGLMAVIILFTLRITRPITGLGEAARRVTAGEIDFLVPVEGPREVSRLATTFNEMLTGLQRNRDLEEQLQRAERSAVVGRLASGIAHEIRNPLNFINLSIDYLRDKYKPADEPGSAEYSRILLAIKDEIGRLNRLVSDFLSYGRSAKLKRREVDAPSLIAEVRDLVSPTASQQQVAIRIEIEKGQNGRICADPENLKTCFSNIMINAL
ncbi:MAG: histidine kinase dimerization/phospho-acceptor domain-containing protein, partial [Acidobacteriota bacterium]